MLYLSALFMDMCLGVVTLAVPLLALSFGASVVQLGFLGMLSSICYAVTCAFTGRLVDRFGPKLLAVSSCFVLSIIYIAVTRIDQLYHMYIFFAMSGITFAFFWPPMENWVAEGKNYEEILKSIGIYNMAWSIGLLLGPLTGGFLFEKGVMAPFYFAAAIAGGLGIFLAFVSRSSTPEAEMKTLNGSYLLREDNRYLMAGWMSNFISWFILGNIRNIFPKLAISTGISAGTLGMLISTVGLAQIFSFYFIRRWEGWHYRIFPLLIFQGMAAVGMLFIYFGRSPIVLAFGMAAIGVSNGMTYYSSIFYSLHRDSKRGLASGLHETILGTGGVLGPLLGGFVASYNIRWPYLMCLVLVAAGIVAESLIVRNSKGHAQRH